MNQNGTEMDILSGPYRATHLWNSIISDFRTKMPLKRHRRQMRQFENCFAASDAINWLHHYLCHNPNFGPNVSRKQTVQLIVKLKQYHIIEDVRGCQQVQAEEFKDNRNLYRFTYHSPVKRSYSCPNRTPLHPCAQTTARENNSNRDQNQISLRHEGDCRAARMASFPQEIPQCRLVTRQLTICEIENTWKATTLGKLQAILNVNSLEGYLDVNTINPKFIIHNVNKINPNGIVLPLNRTEELPHWLLNAMKCLVAWPKASGSGSCLPNYPGFEKDVFRVVRDYFQNIEEPLTTFGMYEILSAVYTRAEFLENNPNLSSVDDNANQEEMGPLTMTASMENLVSGMAQAWTRTSSNSGDELLATSEHSSSYCNTASNKQAQSANSAIGKDVPSNPVLLSGNTCYETAFLTASPVTRMISPTEGNLKLGFFRGPHYSMSSIEVPPDSGKCLMAQSPRCVSVADLHDSQKLFVASCSEKLQASIRGRIKRDPKPESGCSTLHNISRQCTSQVNMCKSESLPWLNKSGGYINLAYTDQSSECLNGESTNTSGAQQENLTSAAKLPSFPLPKKNAVEIPHSNASLSSSCCNGTKDVSIQHPTQSHPLHWHQSNDGDLKSVTNSESPGSALSYDDNIKAFSRNSNRQNSWTSNPDATLSQGMRPQNAENCNADSSFSTMDGKMLATDGLQLSLLCIAPDNRRKLHLLLRFMYRLSNNNHLLLESKTSNRTVVLDTFSRSVVRAFQEVDYNEQLAVRLVAFLMDNHEIILAVPDTLKNQVQERLGLMCQSKIKYSMDGDASALTYCQQVTTEEYEQQRISLSERAMADLLNSIITDPRLTSREKQKKLKQFKKMYPDIYAEKFPSAKKAIPLFSKSLQKLRGLRM